MAEPLLPPPPGWGSSPQQRITGLGYRAAGLLSAAAGTALGDLGWSPGSTTAMLYGPKCPEQGLM